MKKLTLSVVKRMHKYYWNQYIYYYNTVLMALCLDIDDLKEQIGPKNINSECHLCQYACNLSERIVDYNGHICRFCPAVRIYPRRGCLDGIYTKLQRATNKKKDRKLIIDLCIQIRDVKFKEKT